MKRLLLPLLTALALPTAVNSGSPNFAEKGYAASILGANLCHLRQGRLTKQSFVLNVENLMLKKGYDINFLYQDNVRKAGKLIANKLGNNCTNQEVLQEERFIIQITEILREL